MGMMSEIEIKGATQIYIESVCMSICVFSKGCQAICRYALIAAVVIICRDYVTTGVYLQGIYNDIR